ncbi:Tetratricopeptide repeat-containing protein [Paenibacillus polysaccharolyticus]|uniref:Tetratricopeptide repeat-containing protein n=1 Tax=Paenibacillus polysaccharolyticus TaxID=582692 RepID=A0A1G5EJZ8_9BACL|nr:tetratricopeptide repeat protein [Paenibacillus polysaccharolyticus]SCY27284.1 Tetratricopeptide repeat-containing protein [Paenibacillus polysaccharolyticus]
MMKPEDYMQQAYRCILQNDFEQAIRWFEAAIHAHPEHAELYYRCSITHARSKHLLPALEYARKAVELSEGAEEYVLHLQTLEAKQLTVRAKLLLEQAGTESSKPYVEASQLLKEAIRLDPLSVEAHVMLALAHSDLNEYESALQVLQDAIVLDPQNRQLYQMLQQTKQRLKSMQ